MADKRGFFTGTYRNSCKNLLFNRIQYTTFCCILDYYCLFDGYLSTSVDNTRNRLVDLIFAKTDFRRTKMNEVYVSTAIDRMLMIGLIQQYDNDVALTDKGREAFCSQQYHIVLTNINAERQARLLAYLAACIAIVSLIVSLISLFLIK